MNEEAEKKLKEFRAKEGDIILYLFDNMTEKVESKYGDDAAMGFVLALDTVYLALTGTEMENTLLERIKNE